MPETSLTIHGRTTGTVFDLLGTKENDLTYSLGWALANVPALEERILSDVVQRHRVRGAASVTVNPSPGPIRISWGGLAGRRFAPKMPSPSST